MHAHACAYVCASHNLSFPSSPSSMRSPAMNPTSRLSLPRPRSSRQVTMLPVMSSSSKTLSSSRDGGKPNCWPLGGHRSSVKLWSHRRLAYEHNLQFYTPHPTIITPSLIISSPSLTITSPSHHHFTPHHVTIPTITSPSSPPSLHHPHRHFTTLTITSPSHHHFTPTSLHHPHHHFTIPPSLHHPHHHFTTPTIAMINMHK